MPFNVLFNALAVERRFADPNISARAHCDVPMFVQGVTPEDAIEHRDISKVSPLFF
ncbi:hypothetical protein [Nonomuraea africana]|uniref:Uncharacterized protein n=1 Tax=Nonomuraea africana TaxID=46171 RepID=A0ABR9KNJ1_9ACTN|nr:hypothetical protein [Nonomuraea africana]MBE1563600.1 hypothetical protein [Nonomuraea africana]